MVRVEHKQTRVVVTFTGMVTQEGIIELASTIDRLQADYFYRNIDLHIASPGGEVIALDYIIEAISCWKQQDLTLTTRALTACSSAAAIMLSLGDHREASTSSVLHYHNSRISGHGPMTSDVAEDIMGRLKSVDNRLLTQLVEQVMRRGDPAGSTPPDAIVDADRLVLRQMRMDWCGRSGEPPGNESDEMWLDNWLDKTRETGDVREVRTRWARLYDTLLDQDTPISPRLAVRLGLVDRVIEPTSRRWVEAAGEFDGPCIVIPEWETAYPDGRLDERHLRRHTLILGETGAGKTRSAILPTLAAAYRSPRVGVGLVIDPKRELGSVLRELDGNSEGRPGRKTLVWIEPSSTIVNLMENDAWSIGTMVDRHRYFSAARHILRRVASLTESNPARTLLGEPSTDTDSYWPQEGTTLASTVVAMAVEFVTHPKDCTDFVTAEAGQDHMLSVAMARLHAIGVGLGMFEDSRNKYLREAEERGEGGRSTGTPLALPDDSDDTWDDDEDSFGDHGAGEDGEERRREEAFRNLVRQLERHEALLEGREELYRSIVSKLSDGDFSMGGFSAALHEIRSRILLKPQEDVVPNVLAVANAIFEELFSMVEQSDDGKGGRTPLHALARHMRKKGRDGEYDVLAKHMTKYADMRDTVDKQYAGVYGVASTVWQEFVVNDIRSSIYFGCELRGRRSGGATERKFLEFGSYVAKTEEQVAESGGVLHIYQPALNNAGGLMAKACKALFFESILSDEERALNGEKMPLAAYMADEFQRFITVDRVHGEQSFFDVCRSFGAFTVVACQSVASLQYALSTYERDERKRSSAIDIICNNTGTKLFFRSTDRDTAHRLDTICPAMTGGDLVTRVRPLSTLGVGECYASFPDGRFLRVQLEEYPARQ